MTDYSVKSLVEFLEYAANKGLLNKSTANAKRIAVERIFEVAEEAERDDVRTVDLSSLMHRFMNLAGAGFKPDSLSTYQSRVKSGIDEFLAWRANPMAFRPSKRGVGKKPKSPQQAQVEVQAPAPKVASSAPATLSLPIPIRADLTVQVNGLPFDLTKSEATKIANVVLAMATEM
jgi:hypothetical protein